MKSIVIFYSVSGQTEYVGKIMAKELECDYIKIEAEKDIRPDLVRRYVQGSKAMISSSPASLKAYDFKADDYDNIIIGFPNWGSNCPPAMKEFLKENSFAGKKVYLYTTYLARGGRQCLKNTAKRIDEGIISGSQKFSLPRSKKEEEFTDELNAILKDWGLMAYES